MAVNLSQLLQDADEIIEKRASSTVFEKVPQPKEDEVTKLARELVEGEGGTDADEWTSQEKLAHAIMLVATYANLPELTKIAQFESKAAEAGYSSEQIDRLIEKRANAKPVVTLETLIPWLSE